MFNVQQYPEVRFIKREVVVVQDMFSSILSIDG